MKIQVLGCSGGIGGDQHTTAVLVGDDILIDAGTGVGRLSMAALARIDHVFVTHSHLDHLAAIPLMVDTVARMREVEACVGDYQPRRLMNDQVLCSRTMRHHP